MCPNDHYPLSRIDQLVYSMSGHKLICMLNAYQGYHQIPLMLKNQEKVSFVTSNRAFYYTILSFNLKNVRATYQRLMDQVFKDQMERNIEVYVAMTFSSSHPE